MKRSFAIAALAALPLMAACQPEKIVNGKAPLQVGPRPEAAGPAREPIYATPNGWWWDQASLTLRTSFAERTDVRVQVGPTQYPHLIVTLGAYQSVTVADLQCGTYAELFVNNGLAAPQWWTGDC